MRDALTVVFFPEGAFGPTNNCVAIAERLRERGHRSVFVVEESFAGTLEARGFEEALMRLKPPPAAPEEPGQFWKEFVRETAPQFRRATIEQLEGFVLPVWRELVDGARFVEPRLREILSDLGPDVVVEDNVVAFPAVAAGERPWVRIMSCNPLELKDPALPPPYSGYPSGDRTGWEPFRARYAELVGPLQAEFDAWCREQGAPALPPGELIHESQWLNLYLYPAEVDYPRSRTPAPTWHRLDSCVRGSDPPFEVPASLAGCNGRLVYLSLGSLGSADVALMRRLVSVLAETSHRYIVSKGPLHESIELADNMWGDEFVPQASIVPLVDLAISHGGNNTVSECFHHGRPMIVLPLFWDQHDNAQRVAELGFGVRLPTYEFEDRALTGAIDRLLDDEDLAARLRAISGRLSASPGAVLAADLIERLGRTGEPVCRR